MATLIASGLPRLTVLLSLATGLHIWPARDPAWPWFKTSLAALTYWRVR